MRNDIRLGVKTQLSKKKLNEFENKLNGVLGHLDIMEDLKILVSRPISNGLDVYSRLVSFFRAFKYGSLLACFCICRLAHDLCSFHHRHEFGMEKSKGNIDGTCQGDRTDQKQAFQAPLRRSSSDASAASSSSKSFAPLHIVAIFLNTRSRLRLFAPAAVPKPQSVHAMIGA